jgi:uncharacterized protein YdaU (DUF1376 family)
MKRPTLAPVVARISPGALPKKRFPMLPWYPANFMSATRGWSVTARGIYRELLDCQWEIPEGLPTDPAALQRLIGATKAEWREWPAVEPKFPIGADGTRRNQTLEQHRARAMDRSAKAAESAAAKWKRQRGAEPQGGSDANA